MKATDVLVLRERINRLWPIGQPLSLDAMDGYQDRLDDIELEPALAALTAICDEGGRRPQPGELRRRVLDRRPRLVPEQEADDPLTRMFDGDLARYWAWEAAAYADRYGTPEERLGARKP